MEQPGTPLARARQVFLSSTSLDLREHRDAVVRRCTTRGYSVCAMEEFGARDTDASAVSVAEVAPCDVFVGVYARRYGYVPRGSARSVTEMEYEEAARLSKPRLLFVVAPDYDEHQLLERHRDDHAQESGDALRRFLARIGQERVWDTFTTPQHLAERVEFALSKWEGWQPGWPPPLARRFVGRSELVADIRRDTLASRRVALTGIGGIGKSLAALRIAHDLAAECTGGVLWVSLGPAANDPEATRVAVISEWMQRHHPGRLVDPATIRSATVRAWLEEVPGPLLVVLDDVWHVPVASEVLQLVPGNAMVIATSRRGDAVRQLGFERVWEIDRLSDQDALDLLRDRVGDMPSRTDLRKLVSALGGHPLALEIAAAQIQREGPDFATTLPERVRQTMEAGGGDQDIPGVVAATLQITYSAMGEDLKRRFRALGALAAEAPVTPFLMAALWSVRPDEPEALDDAIDRMQALAANAVLSRVPDQRLFSIHALVRAYARRLVRETGELAEIDDRYAKAIVAIATPAFAAPPETWGDMEPYLRHVAFVGDATATQVEDLLGALSPLAEPGAAAKPMPLPESEQARILMLRALNFGTAVARYVRERQMDGVASQRWLQMGVVAARALGEPRWAASFLTDYGSWLVRHGEPMAAIAHFTEAAEIARAEHDEEREATALHRLALADMEIGRYDEAAAIQERVVEIQSRRGSPVERAVALLAQGTLHRRRGDLQQALALYEQALPLLADDLDHRATALNDLGVVYRALGDPAMAVEHFEQALRSYRRTGNRREEATVLGNLAGVAWDLWDVDRAMALYAEQLSMVRDAGDRAAEARVLVNLGTVCEKTGSSDEALRSYEMALPILRELDDDATLAACLNNVAVARLAQGDPHTAVGLLGEALEINRRLGDRQGEAKVLNVLGDARYALRDADGARACYNEALDASREVGDLRSQAQVLQNLGILSHALKEYAHAESMYTQSLMLMRECGNRNGEAVDLSNLASIAFKSGDTVKAKALLEEALAIMREIGDSRSEAAILRNLEDLERETQARASNAGAAAGAASPRDILVRFLEAEGSMRAILYAKYEATLQSAEVDAMLVQLIATAEGSGNAALVDYANGVRAFLRQMRR